MSKGFMRLSFAAIIVCTLLIGCKKDKKQPQPPLIEGPDFLYVDYAHYQTGNYWIYQLYQLDSSYNGTPLNIYDSVYVGKDSLYNGKTYHTVFKPVYPGATAYGVSLYRDSLPFIVDIRGNIVFSSLNANTVFRSRYLLDSAISPVDSVGLVQEGMGADFVSFTVPAGTFITKTFSTTWYMNPYFWSTGKVRTLYTRYSGPVGIVSETLPFYVNDASYQERRLVRYHFAN